MAVSCLGTQNVQVTEKLNLLTYSTVQFQSLILNEESAANLHISGVPVKERPHRGFCSKAAANLTCMSLISRDRAKIISRYRIQKQLAKGQNLNLIVYKAD